jgi:hypothetical protein
MKRKSQEDFIKECVAVHGNKYDYSKTIYTTAKNKIKITCRIHGDFFQNPFNHLFGKGCKKCGIQSNIDNQSSTTEDFIKKAMLVHGAVYDYSKVHYSNNENKIEIICSIHGSYFQSPSNHLAGKKCTICALKKRGLEHRLTKETFVKKAIATHGSKYSYSESNYNGIDIKIKIHCNTCNVDFYQQPNNHINGQGCNQCLDKMTSKEDFIRKSIETHGDKYDYSKSIYVDSGVKITIICNTCKLEFKQGPGSHFRGAGCVRCANIKNNNKKRKTLEQFIFEANGIHGIGRYDYSEVEYFNSNSKVLIKCNECLRKFKQIVTNHLGGKGCLKCSVKLSKPEIAWLNYLNIAESDRQIRIKKYTVDGYDVKTNTIYEFNGDFWHGNPEIYPADKINTKVNKTFGELYQKTLKKEASLKTLGYNVVSIWESDWENEKRRLKNN